jgi:hypothetical protein
MLEAEMTIHGVEPLNSETVKSCNRDLLSLLTETDIASSKRFLRSFISRIVIEETKGTIYYKLPVPPEWKEQDEFSVLPIEPPSGAGGVRTPYLLRAKQAFSQLNYGPILTPKLYHIYRNLI